MKISYVSCVILVSMALFSCTKNAPGVLPDATQTGANTFGCKIDGTVWVPSDVAIVSAPKLEARIAGSDLFINARNLSSSPIESEFEIYVKGLVDNGVGNYTLGTGPSHPDYTNSYVYYVHRNLTPDNEWVTTSPYTGSVNITKIDTVNHFISGTFAFRAINLYNAPQPISVSEGRFDVKFE